jgi:hypothetical protein
LLLLGEVNDILSCIITSFLSRNVGNRRSGKGERYY